MKKRFFILSISLTFISIIHAAQYIENPLIISTAEGLSAFSESVNNGNSYQG